LLVVEEEEDGLAVVVVLVAFFKVHHYQLLQVEQLHFKLELVVQVAQLVVHQEEVSAQILGFLGVFLLLYGQLAVAVVVEPVLVKDKLREGLALLVEVVRAIQDHRKDLRDQVVQILYHKELLVAPALLHQVEEVVEVVL
jgi:hypothetical protein